MHLTHRSGVKVTIGALHDAYGSFGAVHLYGTKGDLVVTVDVAVPARLSHDAKEALKAYAASTSDHDPRADLLSRARKADGAS